MGDLTKEVAMNVVTVTAGPRGKIREFSTKAWHIRQKAVRRERRRLPIITLAIEGIL
jgi:hypothetical protein